MIQLYVANKGLTLDPDVNRFKKKDAKTLYVNEESRVALLISDKIYFKSKWLQETRGDIIY